tara:strand:- start:359 stop:868 length:510 start_codon:yes stop_codon:yes gene_type:complete
MNYLGLDCSSKAVHGVIVNEAEAIINKLKFDSTPKDSFDNRLYQIFDKFAGYLNQELEYNNIQCSAIEAAIYIQNARTTMNISGVVGIAKYLLHTKGIVCYPVDNKTWKKRIVGKGNVGKPDIKKFAIDKWGDVFPEQDYADAACIALWAKRWSTYEKERILKEKLNGR